MNLVHNQISLVNFKKDNLILQKLKPIINKDIQLNDKDKVYQIGLSLVKGIGGLTFKKLIETFGSAENVFKSKFANLCKISGIGPLLAKNILEKKYLIKAEKIIECSNKSNFKILSYFDKEYPSRLRNIFNPPPILYYKGNISLNEPKIISIVGTRIATHYGKNFLSKLIEELKYQNIIVVSGLAIGIDCYTHKEALNNNLKNIGVLPCSIDEIYPLKHTNLANEILKNGALLSEYDPFVNKEKYLFPARNRIIAGISDATIVIEAGKKSGALITAEYANNYNKEVFALPGDVGKKSSEGCNKLIFSHKAHILSDIKNINYIMNWDTKLKTSEININKTIKLDLNEKSTVDSLGKFGSNGVDLLQLSINSGIETSKLSSVIMKLEMKSLIEKLPGGKIALKYA